MRDTQNEPVVDVCSLLVAGVTRRTNTLQSCVCTPACGVRGTQNERVVTLAGAMALLAALCDAQAAVPAIGPGQAVGDIMDATATSCSFAVQWAGLCLH